MHTWVGTPSSPPPLGHCSAGSESHGLWERGLVGRDRGPPCFEQTRPGPNGSKVCALPERHQEQS